MNKFLIGAFSAFFCAASFAADIPQDNSLDTIIFAFKNQASTWEPVIYTLTLGLFSGLVIISFTWTFMQMVIKEGTGLVDVLAELTRRTLLIGFSIYLIQNAPDLGRILIQSFVEVGSRISDGAITFSPSNVFELGLNIVAIAWDATSFTDPVATILMVFVALIVMVCFAIMAMDMTILIVSGYIIVSGGIIAMGFLGSDWTKENALNYFTAVLGIAFKMFVMQLVFITGYSFIEAWGSTISDRSSNTDYLAMVGVCIVFAGLMREIPALAASLASGRFTMSGGGVQSAAMGVAAGAAGAALLASGAGMVAAKQAMSSFNGMGGDSNDAPSSGSSDEATSSHTFDTGQGDTSTTLPPNPHSAPQSHETPYSESPSSPINDTPPHDGAQGSPESSSASSKVMSGAKGLTTASAKVAGTGLKAMGKVAHASLHSVATRTAFGALLAEGAKKLGEDPVDFDHAAKEDIIRQLNAASSASSTQPPLFDDSIEAAPSTNTTSQPVETPSHVEEEKQDNPDKD
ncbi:P-type conjugative transfer protein TrbL [Vibrio owensii]|uniref:P-type conjugative transfer protein TrbL n=1 Tax=Vibrio owensii TaxID=696485 RepID=UPI0038CE6DDD